MISLTNIDSIYALLQKPIRELPVYWTMCPVLFLAKEIVRIQGRPVWYCSCQLIDTAFMYVQHEYYTYQVNFCIILKFKSLASR